MLPRTPYIKPTFKLILECAQQEPYKMKLPLFVLTLALCASTSRGEDKVLRELELKLETAQTQWDLNLASGEIADYVDKKLSEREQEVAKDLDSEGIKLFRDASKAWRAYRDMQMAFEGHLYRGGSMRPLIHNQTFIRITKERLDVLSRIGEP
jgi:uncharacterized protein YecT (DUF1311 family)